MGRPKPVSLSEFLIASERERTRHAAGDDSPCCTGRSCVLCRAAAEEDHYDAEREERRSRRARGED